MRLHHDLETAELRMRVRSARTELESARTARPCLQVGRLELDRDGAISDGAKAASDAEASTLVLATLLMLPPLRTIRPAVRIVAAKQSLVAEHEAELSALTRELQELAKQLEVVEDRAARDRTRLEQQHAAMAQQARHQHVWLTRERCFVHALRASSRELRPRVIAGAGGLAR